MLSALVLRDEIEYLPSEHLLCGIPKHLQHGPVRKDGPVLFVPLPDPLLCAIDNEAVPDLDIPPFDLALFQFLVILPESLLGCR